jgi:hypothetical protein
METPPVNGFSTKRKIKNMFQWGFHYSGPRGAVVDMDCVTCRAKSTGKCAAHDTNFVKNCAHCQAAGEGAPCQGHWGLTAALDDYEKRLTGQQLSNFQIAKEMVLGQPLHPSWKNVTATARGNGNLDDSNECEFVITMKAWP